MFRDREQTRNAFEKLEQIEKAHQGRKDNGPWKTRVGQGGGRRRGQMEKSRQGGGQRRGGAKGISTKVTEASSWQGRLDTYVVHRYMHTSHR